tara:strand:- start:2292 stop:2972 length:681 start_codon:yes stop_codon:yes gene_type:complete
MENHPTRVKYDNPKMYRWKSWDANTPFAPSFDVPVYIDYCGETITKDLIELCSKNKFSRDNWTQYNIFCMTDFVVAILSDRIYQIYEEYAFELNQKPVPKHKLWIRGWGVTLEDGKGIDHHSHAFHENSFLSGNISLSDLDTTTDYLFPYLGWYFGYWKLKNKLGQLTLFPSWLEHKVDINNTGKVRFSLAFDIFTEHTINYVSNNRTNSSALQNTIRLSKRMNHV